MSNKPKSKEKKDQYIQMAAESSRSEDEIKDKDKNRNLQVENQTKEDRSFVVRNKKQLVAGGGVALAVLGVIIYQTFQPEFTLQSQYEFTIYCPISPAINAINAQVNYPVADDLQQRKTQTDFRFLTDQFSKRLLTQEKASKKKVDKYLIYVQANDFVKGNQTIKKFTYCSWVASWSDKECKNPRQVCSVPGPLFYVKRDQIIDVAWVYNLNQFKVKQIETEPQTCYKDPNNHHCKLPKKTNSGCTYSDPTHQQKTTFLSKPEDNFQISSTSIPISVHIHGLQVRPVFDGNPLSWLGPNNQLGPGFQSLILNQKYFETFEQTETTQLLPQSTGSFYFKVNRYHNVQPPGNLWYHDHSMHVTQANVMYGMAGDYIIHDPKVDEQLPGGQYEIFIVAGENFKTQNGINEKTRKEKDTQHSGVRYNPPEVPFATQIKLSFKRNQNYRIRLLNAQFDSVFQDIRFVTQCDQSADTVNPDTCKKNLTFTVIGSDSCLFSNTVPGVTSLILSSAERFELLIVFDGIDEKGNIENQISQDANFVYLVTKSDNQKNSAFIRLKYPLAKEKSSSNKWLPKNKLKIDGIEFYDLSQSHIGQKCKPNNITTQCLSVERIRPYFADSAIRFYFNGHYQFGSSGASDNPKIGTTEDWYFLNNMWFGHPVHVHLISFQVISKATLADVTYSFINEKKEPDSHVCSFYEIYFYIESGLIREVLPNAKSYYDICVYIRTQLDASKQGEAFQYIRNYYPQDKLNEGSDIVSGFEFRGPLDAEKLAQYTYDKPQNVNISFNCQTRAYMYICDQLTTDIPQQYRRWKEVFYMPEMTVFQVRIRWASTEFNTPLMKDPYPYFHIPEDQLIQYPGYVYHCHFLHHQDNQLMRSIMMQPSDKFAEHYKPEDSPIGECIQQQKKLPQNKDKTEWQVRSICVNNFVGCK